MFTDNKNYKVIRLKNREEWLKERQKRIGGSDASAMIGMNPWKSKAECWRSKMLDEIQEITSPAIEYGTKAEEHIRALFQLKHPELTVFYESDVILDSEKHYWMAYSPDGLIQDGNRKGILEIKTTLIRNKQKLEEWNDQIPQHYYIQVLHGLAVTGFDFVILCAEIRFPNGEAKIIERGIEREDREDDIEYLITLEKEEWERWYVTKIEPPIEIHV